MKRALYLVVAPFLVACGSDDPPPPAYPTAPTATATATVAPSATTTAPPAVSAAPCDAVQSQAFGTMLQARAKDEAPGMEADGAPLCAMVPEGQTAASATMMLQPGYCYTFLAQGLPNVQEVDISVSVDFSAAAPAIPALAALKAPIATDSTTGVMAAIGPKKDCYQWPWPLPAAVKVEVKARMGSGPIAAQAFKKKK